MVRRRRYFIEPGFQIRYAGIILLTLFISSAICIFTTYYSSISLLGEKLAHVYPQGRLVVTIKQVNLIIAYRLLFLVPVLALFGLMLSHRIAGPAHRIERTLREIGKGNFDIHIDLRKYDELGRIANAMNDMALDLKKLIKDKETGNGG
ncbi:MAG: HAMP domain-containing protein [Candidatus Omnitrophota bacterium]